MRILKSRESPIKILRPTMVTGSMGSVTVSWDGTPSTVYGDVQPLTSEAARREYGERAEKMRKVILPRGEYEVGDGVWLQNETGSTPPWLIASVANWALTELVIERK